MKKNRKPLSLFNLLIIGVLTLTAVSCKKENSAGSETTTQAAIAEMQAIAVSGTATSANERRGDSPDDSLYVVNTCPQRSHPDSIAFSSLPASVIDYLLANYPGYTAQKAYTINSQSGTLQGYIAIITYNDKPVGVRFDASGNFVQVLEQREGRDLNGPGYHHGGHFDDRDGRRRDTIALSALPAAITSYFATNYPQDTLSRAFRNRDSSILVVSINNGVFATVFDAANNFVKRVQLPARPGRPVAIDQSALPSGALSYLATTYPNYVFKRAFRISSNGVVQGYVAVIDANETKYAVLFNASGSFVSVKTIR